MSKQTNIQIILSAKKTTNKGALKRKGWSLGAQGRALGGGHITSRLEG